jgi:trans-aconitate methyltransferase
MNKSGLWSDTDAYERYMGRWSRKVAGPFLRWLDPPQGQSWIDIGCGSGCLTEQIASSVDAASIIGVDTAEGFIKIGRERVQNVDFRIGSADNLNVSKNSIDFAVSGLMLNFVPDPQAALSEMVRVVRPSGTVALYVWDYSGQMQIMRYFFDAAKLFDGRASQFDDGIQAPICRPEPLKKGFEAVGLVDVSTTALDIPTAFENFDDYWQPFLGGVGSAPKYCKSLDESTRNKIRHSLQARLPTSPDGQILLAARAWAVRGTVPGGA